jgi:hypothetical protein
MSYRLFCGIIGISGMFGIVVGSYVSGFNLKTMVILIWPVYGAYLFLGIAFIGRLPYPHHQNRQLIKIIRKLENEKECRSD